MSNHKDEDKYKEWKEAKEYSYLRIRNKLLEVSKQSMREHINPIIQYEAACGYCEIVKGDLLYNWKISYEQIRLIEEVARTTIQKETINHIWKDKARKDAGFDELK